MSPNPAILLRRAMYGFLDAAAPHLEHLRPVVANIPINMDDIGPIALAAAPGEHIVARKGTGTGGYNRETPPPALDVERITIGNQLIRVFEAHRDSPVRYAEAGYECDCPSVSDALHLVFGHALDRAALDHTEGGGPKPLRWPKREDGGDLHARMDATIDENNRRAKERAAVAVQCINAIADDIAAYLDDAPQVVDAQQAIYGTKPLPSGRMLSFSLQSRASVVVFPEMRDWRFKSRD